MKTKQIIQFLLLTTLIFNFSYSASPNKTMINILYTCNTNGVLRNCHCPISPLGGLEKRQTILGEYRKSHSNVLLLDSGDFLSFTGSKINDEKVMKIMDLMDYDAINIGDQEFANGPEFLTKLLKENEINILSTNLNYFNDTSLQIPNVIYKTIDSVKIAILGIVGQEGIKYYEKELNIKINTVEPFKSIKNWYKNTDKDKFDIIILLSNMGFDNDKKIVEQVDFIDIIVGGHTQNEFHKPKDINGTIILQAGSGGKYIGQLEIKITNKQINSYSGKLIPVKLETKDDKQILKILDE